MEATASLTTDQCDFIAAQHIFFVGSAPMAGDGRVNISPKGLESLAILSDSSVAYIDLGGSGIETHAHLLENGRLCFMFCAFEGEPKVLRLHGKGSTALRGTPEFDVLREHFPAVECPVRGIIRLEIDRVHQSCGYGVPLYEFVGQRPTLAEKISELSQEGWTQMLQEWNAQSIDGLPGL